MRLVHSFCILLTSLMNGRIPNCIYVLCTHCKLQSVTSPSRAPQNSALCGLFRTVISYLSLHFVLTLTSFAFVLWMTDSGLFCLNMSVITVDNYSRAIIQNIIFVSPDQMSSSSLSSTATAWAASWLGSFMAKLIWSQETISL